MLENNNHKNSNCAFGEELVSYLYGECGAEEKKTFEKHLTSCAGCLEEFAGFNAARSLVTEWRDKEFLPLEVPLFVLPNSKQLKSEQSKATKIISRLWLDDVRNFLTLSPATYAFGTIAIFAVCLGLIFFGQRSSQTNEIAGIANKNIEPIKTSQNFNNANDLSPAKPNQPEQNSAEMITPVQQSVSQRVVSSKNNQRAAYSQTNFANKNTVSSNFGKSNLNANISNQRTNSRTIRTVNPDGKKPIFAQNSKLPRLNTIEDDEDKSLRLAELLEEDGEAR